MMTGSLAAVPEGTEASLNTVTVGDASDDDPVIVRAGMVTALPMLSCDGVRAMLGGTACKCVIMGA